MKNLEKRMYFLVPYNISDIQKSIQAGHAALEYAHIHGNDEEYIDFIENWKTWIILNGGTTNSNLDSEEIPRGTLDRDFLSIIEYNETTKHGVISPKIKYSRFNEPDLNNALTAVCLVVDERVFNREDYPDFREWTKKWEHEAEYFNWSVEKQIDEYIKDIGIDYKTYFLKELLNTKKLA